MAAPGSPYRREAGGVVLTVRVTPRAGRDAIDGIGRLSDGRAAALVRVRALPTEGEANDALVALLAKRLRVPKSALTISGGHRARLKQVRIAGEPDALGREIDAWGSANAPPSD
ncbi:MAG TPA: DUF167 family protein [Bauldia sp.]|nr:DUF167 family protein [Bauldia sp.]